MPVGEVCRGMGVSKRCEMRRLRDESRKLKTLVVDLTLDKHIPQEALGKVVVRGTEFDPTPFLRQGWIGWADWTLTGDSGIPGLCRGEMKTARSFEPAFLISG